MSSAENPRAAGLLTVACVMIFAVRDLSTRVMADTIGTFQLVIWANLALIPAGIGVLSLGARAAAQLAG